MLSRAASLDADCSVRASSCCIGSPCDAYAIEVEEMHRHSAKATEIIRFLIL